MATHPEVACPTCRKRGPWLDSPFGPFCSERCKWVDLGRWLDEDHRIGEPLADSEGAEGANPEAEQDPSGRKKSR